MHEYVPTLVQVWFGLSVAFCVVVLGAGVWDMFRQLRNQKDR
jgi:hypothetical protein